MNIRITVTNTKQKSFVFSEAVLNKAILNVVVLKKQKTENKFYTFVALDHQGLAYIEIKVKNYST